MGRWMLPVLLVGLAACPGRMPPPPPPGGSADGPIGASAAPAAPIAAVPFLPVGNATNWILQRPLVYRVGRSRDSVVVPTGFVTDFASIPQGLQSFFSKLGPHLLPAVVHDYLYWEQGCTREQSDNLFLLAMEEMGVSAGDRTMILAAVRTPGGQLAWDGNRRDRAAGLPRVVPPSGVRGPQPLEPWADYRRYLHGAGIRPGPPTPISPAFCRHGGPG